MISAFGLALPAMTLKDLGVKIGKMLSSVLNSAKEGANLLVECGWLEQIPESANRKMQPNLRLRGAAFCTSMPILPGQNPFSALDKPKLLEGSGGLIRNDLKQAKESQSRVPLS